MKIIAFFITFISVLFYSTESNNNSVGKDSIYYNNVSDNIDYSYLNLSKTKVEIDTLLKIPVYDGKNSITHPSVIYAPESWNNYKYWMAFTPYPDASRENPSIIVSNDGSSWVNPSGIINPICTREEAVKDGYQYNSDPNLVLRNDKVMVLYYRLIYGYPQKYEGIFMKTSKDGVIWNNKKELITASSEYKCESLMSPSILQIDETKFYMWTVNNTTLDNAKIVEIRYSPDGINWSKPETCNIPSIIRIWHLEVRKIGEEYLMLVVDSNNYKLHLLKSRDGKNWDLYQIAELKLDKISHNACYKSSFISEENNPMKINIWAVIIKNDGPTIWTATHNIILCKNIDVNLANLLEESIGERQIYLSQNFPNPFNGTTEVIYQVNENSRVSMTLYDSMGKIITTLINEEKPAGKYKYMINMNKQNDVRSIPSGVYYYKIQIGKYSRTNKMIYLK